jgi:DNA-directed RNA polymerase specialized sigma24 family protein
VLEGCTAAAAADRSEHATGLHALLRALGGPERYLGLRARLVACLRQRLGGCADDLADETLDRVGTALACGEQLRDPARYAFGVARRVAMETSRRWWREHGAPLASQPEPVDATAAIGLADEHGLASALERLEPDERALLDRYGELDGRGRGAARKALAAELGIGVNTLRIRVHRARKRLRAELAR